MTNMINADILAQMANSEIENANVLSLLGRDLNSAKIGTEELTALDQLRAANSLKVASSAAVETLRPLAKDQFKQLFGEFIGDKPFRNGIFRMFETRSYTWENVHIDNDTLRKRNELFRQIKQQEAELKSFKAQLKGYDEALAEMFPKSDAIHRKTVLQVL